MAQQGISPRPGWLRQSASPAFAQARRRGSAMRPAAISGHGSASKRAQEVREALANASRQLSRVEKGRKGESHGGRARRRHGRRWRGAGRLTLGSEGGVSSSATSRKARRSCGREQSENGAVVREFDAGGARARRGRSSGLAALAEEKAVREE